MTQQNINTEKSREKGNLRAEERHPTNGNRRRKHKDLYQDVTDKIIAELKAGSVPWVQPWGMPHDAGTLGLPTNGHTNNTYSGINILLLWAGAFERGHTTQKWVTFKQALELGGNVRKGERGHMVVYADSFIPKDERERAKETGDNPQSIGFLKRYTVFNADQCEGLPVELYGEQAALPEREAIPHAEALIAASGANFRIGGPRAYYVPSEDFIQIPPQQTFFEQINYYRTCFHELGHWTGHKSRLDRQLKTKKGTKNYAREELVAEMTTAFVCAALGIIPTVRHTDYLASWLQELKEDNRAIFRAASLASKAADYILAFHNPTPSQKMEVAA